MIDLNMLISRMPPPHPGVILEQRDSGEGWMQLCMYASNLADYSDSKREDMIVWAFDVTKRLSNSGHPYQFVIIDA